jgi:membrane protein involved in colicin uptake
VNGIVTTRNQSTRGNVIDAIMIDVKHARKSFHDMQTLFMAERLRISTQQECSERVQPVDCREATRPQQSCSKRPAFLKHG